MGQSLDPVIRCAHWFYLKELEEREIDNRIAVTFRHNLRFQSHSFSGFLTFQFLLSQECRVLLVPFWYVPVRNTPYPFCYDSTLQSDNRVEANPSLAHKPSICNKIAVFQSGPAFAVFL
jgi:hypothetical protein